MSLQRSDEGVSEVLSALLTLSIGFLMLTVITLQMQAVATDKLEAQQAELASRELQALRSDIAGAVSLYSTGSPSVVVSGVTYSAEFQVWLEADGIHTNLGAYPVLQLNIPAGLTPCIAPIELPARIEIRIQEGTPPASCAGAGIWLEVV